MGGAVEGGGKGEWGVSQGGITKDGEEDEVAIGVCVWVRVCV